MNTQEDLLLKDEKLFPSIIRKVTTLKEMEKLYRKFKAMMKLRNEKIPAQPSLTENNGQGDDGEEKYFNLDAYLLGHLEMMTKLLRKCRNKKKFLAESPIKSRPQQNSIFFPPL